jgi:hypothetical protein
MGVKRNRIGQWLQDAGDALERGRRFIAHDVWHIGGPGEQVSPGIIIKHIRVAILLVKGVLKDDLLLRASALTFATMLAIVPFLALMFYMIQSFHVEQWITDTTKMVFGTDVRQLNRPTIHDYLLDLFQPAQQPPQDLTDQASNPNQLLSALPRLPPRLPAKPRMRPKNLLRIPRP